MMDLRQYLRDTAPELGTSLDNSWRIAEHEWAAMLSVDGESQAGLPHLVSVEGWLNTLAEQCRPRWSKHGESPFGLNSAELYILLASVLFHDIGRPAKFIDPKDHGKASKVIIENNWERLGIKDARMAHEIGQIAEFHTSEKPWGHSSVARILPWGPVHTESLAAVLTLVDELDTAFTRATPDYLHNPQMLWDKKTEDDTISFQDLYNEVESQPENALTTKGVYRRFINSVEFDLTSHLIKTSIRNNSLPGGYIFENEGNMKDWQKDCEAAPINDADTNDKERLKNLFFHFMSYFEKDKYYQEIPNFLARLFFASSDFPKQKAFQKLDCFGHNNPLLSDIFENTIYWNRSWHIARPQPISKDLYYINHFKVIQDFWKQMLKDTITQTIEHFEDFIKDSEKTTYQNLLVSISSINIEIQKMMILDIASIEEKKNSKYQTNSQDLYTTIAIFNQKRIFDSSLTTNLIQVSDTRRQHIKQAPQSPELNSPLKAIFDSIKNMPKYPKWFKETIWNIWLRDKTEGKYPKNAKAEDETKEKIEFILQQFIDFFYNLSFIDLKSAFSQPKQNEDVQNFLKCIASHYKNPESWPFFDFAENLFLALHICVLLLRQCLKVPYSNFARFAPCNDCDFHFEHTIKNIENFVSSLTATPISEITYEHLKNLFQEVSNVSKEDKKTLKKSFDKPFEECTKAFDAISELWKDRLIQKKDLKVKEVEQAIEFMFMLWVAHDTDTKRKKLKNISEALRRVDVPFEDWFMEYNNQLFDENWKMVIEPVIRPENLVDTYSHLRELWLYTKGREKQIHFESLSALLHEPNQDKVNLRTNRLHNLLYLCHCPNGRIDETKQKKFYFEDLMRRRLIREANQKNENEYLHLHSGPDFWSFGADDQLPDVEQMRQFLEKFQSDN